MTERHSFWADLKSRHVVRAAIAHIVLFWLLAQVAEIVMPYLGVVDEPIRWAVVAGVALFPVTLLTAWFFEHPWHRFTGSRMIIDLVVIAVIAVTAGSWVIKNIPQVVHARTSIAILPFEFSTEASGERALSRALALEINSLLMKSKSIDVIGFESASSPLLSGLSLPAIAERLGVEFILAGTISLASQSMKLSFDLRDHLGNSLWIRQINENVDKLYSVQEYIANEIANRLGTGEDRVSIAKIAAERCPMPTNPIALEKYYTARHYVGMRNSSPESNLQLAEAVKIYATLIDQYPEFGEAKSGLAWALYHQSNYDSNANREENTVRYLRAARNAKNQCANLGELLLLLPNENEHENFWISSHRQMTAATEMEPTKSTNFQILARHYADSGLSQRAIEIAEKDYQLNPLSVRSIKQTAGAYLSQQRLVEADALFKLAIELGSNSPNFALDAIERRACKGDLGCLGDWWIDYMELKDQADLDRIRAIMTIPSNDGDPATQIVDLVSILREHPDWVNNLVFFPCRFDHLRPAFFQFPQIAQEANAYWWWPNVWMPQCKNLWSAPEFPTFVESAGLVEYWREVGWPEMCWPVNDGFACGVKLGE